MLTSRCSLSCWHLSEIKGVFTIDPERIHSLGRIAFLAGFHLLPDFCTAAGRLAQKHNDRCLLLIRCTLECFDIAIDDTLQIGRGIPDFA